MSGLNFFWLILIWSPKISFDWVDTGLKAQSNKYLLIRNLFIAHETVLTSFT